ncbi:MAG: M28 family peptidase [candidate division Zixibacteria bacterium]|nr:M28 family peptidase [candidate division Zixibacteria bacterium]
MRFHRLLWMGLWAGCGLVAAASAEDLTIISIESEQQAEYARQVCGPAYLRVNDGYLVAVTPTQRAELTATGIAMADILRDADIAMLSLVLDHPAGVDTQTDLSSYGRAISLPDGTTLLAIGPSAATSFRAATGLKITSLANWQTRIEYSPPRVYWNLSADAYPTDSLVNMINLDTLKALDQRLEAFYTRYIWTDSIRKARDWMVQRFQSWGYSNVTTPSFSWGGGTHYNVQAIKTGYAEPNSYIVIGGHYDSYNQQSFGSAYAPGADDDGSGTALTLELARVFSKIPTRKSIRFIPFSAEEVGLVGSNAAATGFKNAGTNIECMYNFDMVGYEPASTWGLNLSSASNTAYRQIAVDAATRLTSIVPYITGMGSSSDHYSFYQKGFDIVDHIERNFNTDGWHTDLDLSSRMNFPYFTQVAKLAIASIAIAANAGKPGNIGDIVDDGNGNSVTVSVSGCHPSSTYWIRYGTASTALIDSFPVPAGACSVSVTGLTQGIKYYFGVFELPSDGYRSVWSTTASQTPLLVPRAPLGLVASPQASQIDLAWTANKEGDLDHYNIYRKLQGIGDYTRIAANLTGLSFSDTHIVRQIPYEYVVTAVDHDGYESPVSQSILSYAATFDGGILVVDEFTQENYTQPTQAHQEAWLDTIFGATPYAIVKLDTTTDKLTRNHVGRFSSIIWEDDDNFMKLLGASSDPVSWFLSHPTNMLISGYHTIEKASISPVPASHYLKTEFGLSTYSPVVPPDFIGAKGENGWPSVEVGPTRMMLSLNYISKLTSVPGVTVIYRYDSEVDDPANENQPVGLAWNSPHGKRVLLSFPLYHLTPFSVKALISKAVEYFGESSGGVVNGDLDLTGTVDIADLSSMIDYLFISFALPSNLKAADVDHSCNVDISDLSYLIGFLFMGGPAPLEGCLP